MNLISKLRKEQGISQKQLGKLLNVGQQCISSWENERTNPTPFQMQQMEELFKMKKEKIFSVVFYGKEREFKSEK